MSAINWLWSTPQSWAPWMLALWFYTFAASVEDCIRKRSLSEWRGVFIGGIGISYWIPICARMAEKP